MTEPDPPADLAPTAEQGIARLPDLQAPGVPAALGYRAAARFFLFAETELDRVIQLGLNNAGKRKIGVAGKKDKDTEAILQLQRAAKKAARDDLEAAYKAYAFARAVGGDAADRAGRQEVVDATTRALLESQAEADREAAERAMRRAQERSALAKEEP